MMGSGVRIPLAAPAHDWRGNTNEFNALMASTFSLLVQTAGTALDGLIKAAVRATRPPKSSLNGPGRRKRGIQCHGELFYSGRWACGQILGSNCRGRTATTTS